MNTYTPTGAVTKISDTVWAVPTATGIKYFTPGIEGWNGTESELMPLRAGGGGKSTQIPWEVAQRGEFGRYMGSPLGFGGESIPVNGTTGNAGWFFDTNPGQATYNYDEGGSFFGDVLSNFVSGPGVPLAGFMGAGAFNSGGLGNFLNSFGGGAGGAAGAAGGAMDMGVGLSDVFGLGDVPWGVNPQSGGGMDWWDDFINAVGDAYPQGNSGVNGMADIDSWLAGEGNFVNDILGTGPRLPNGTPVDLWLSNTARTLGNIPTSLVRGLLGGDANNIGRMFGQNWTDSGGGFGSSLMSSLPIMAAIDYAKSQGPFDTSRLEGLFDQYKPGAAAFSYDQNTQAGRRALEGSLASRGVLGSSFGNMDMTNFDTTRELGRNALVNQSAGVAGGLASNILDAQVKSRALKNDLYGRSLLALGNVFGGRQSPTFSLGGF